MVFRIILVLVVLILFLFPGIWEGIKAILGAFFVSCLVCSVGGLFVNWVIFGDLFCWDALKIGFYVGLVIAAVAVVITGVKKLFCTNEEG